MEKITAETLADMIREGYEDHDTPAKMLAVLADNEGKQLNKRIVPKLAAAGLINPRLRRQYGMTHIEADSPTERDADGRAYTVSLLIAHTESAIDTPSPDVIRDKNACYFSAAKQRDARRDKALAATDKLAEAAESINAIREHWARLKSLTDYGKTLDPLCYKIDTLTGLQEKRDR